MTKKIFVLVLMFGVILGLGFMGVQNANAQTASFPAGCSSALGFSVTTGLPCNGTSTATMGPLPGCTTALGYSITNGRPCSGGPVAIFYLAGCTSTIGYSTITGAPCNGTSTATPMAPVVVVTTPGLPTTGAGGNASSNILYLLGSGILGVLGVVYLVRKSRIA